MSQVKKPKAPPSHAYAKLAHSLVQDFVTRCLSREERLVVTLHYAEGLTMEEIGAVLDFSATRARDIREDVVTRVRMHLDPASATPILVA